MGNPKIARQFHDDSGDCGAMKIVILITVIESSAVMLAILYFYYRRRQSGKRDLVFVAGRGNEKWVSHEVLVAITFALAILQCVRGADRPLSWVRLSGLQLPERKHSRGMHTRYFSVCFWDRWQCCSFFNFDTELNGTTLSFREQMVKPRTAKSKVDEAKRWVQFRGH
jgi:hypothetical protein